MFMHTLCRESPMKQTGKYQSSTPCWYLCHLLYDSSTGMAPSQGSIMTLTKIRGSRLVGWLLPSLTIFEELDDWCPGDWRALSPDSTPFKWVEISAIPAFPTKPRNCWASTFQCSDLGYVELKLFPYNFIRFKRMSRKTSRKASRSFGVVSDGWLSVSHSHYDLVREPTILQWVVPDCGSR